MTKRSEFLGALVGDWHTDHYLAAVIDDLGEAEQAMLALEQAGWKPDDLRLFQGKPAGQRIEDIEKHHSLAERIGAAVRGASSDEGPISETYEAEAERGHQIVAVYAHTPAQVERARALLARHGAHAMEYFGSWVITDLPAQEGEQPKA